MSVGKTIVAVIALSACCAAFARTESERCVVQHPRGGNGARITASMSVINDGSPCVMRVQPGHRPATSVTIRGQPASGTLSATESSVAYTPKPGFVGNDSFDVQWFGIGFGPNSKSHNVRTKVEVTVRAAADEPDSLGDEPEAKSAKPGM